MGATDAHSGRAAPLFIHAVTNGSEIDSMGEAAAICMLPTFRGGTTTGQKKKIEFNVYYRDPTNKWAKETDTGHRTAVIKWVGAALRAAKEVKELCEGCDEYIELLKERDGKRATAYLVAASALNYLNSSSFYTALSEPTPDAFGTYVSMPPPTSAELAIAALIKNKYVVTGGTLACDCDRARQPCDRRAHRLFRKRDVPCKYLTRVSAIAAELKIPDGVVCDVFRKGLVPGVLEPPRPGRVPIVGSWWENSRHENNRNVVNMAPLPSART
jgi:hypothetical protein